MARRLGASRRTRDHLVCGWVCEQERETGSSGAGFTHIQAIEDGWWYTAPIPQSPHAGLPHRLGPAGGASGDATCNTLRERSPNRRIRRDPEPHEVVEGVEHGVTPASSSVLEPCGDPPGLRQGTQP